MASEGRLQFPDSAAASRAIQDLTRIIKHIENGFFTGLAELRNGRWQFRDAHWSIVAPAPPR
jgi:hypothetical protein